MMWPVDVRTVSQEFGQYPNGFQPDGHTGMDFAVPRGTPVRAAAPGTVLHADWAQGLGWPNPYWIAIDFDGPWNGDQSAGIVVVIDHGSFVGVYAHLDQTGLNPGDHVSEGELIGQVGRTGRSTGYHLHFEVLPDGWDVHSKWYGRRNPRDYVKTTQSKPPAPPMAAVVKDEDMNPVYVRDSPQGLIYALNTVTGKKRPVPTSEWLAIRAAYTAAKQPAPVGTIPAAHLKVIPNG